jgi:tyrosyl-tRNA synthetase
MILQAYDFFELNQKYNCRLQIGGSDQWGNIVNGTELIRRTRAKEAFGLTSPLLTTADGKKMGKTAEGAVWLDSELLSVFDYFQYFRNTHDEDVGKFLRLFTDLEIPEIEKLEKLKDQEINKAKEILAFEATKICHGEKSANEALQKAREIFVGKNSSAFEDEYIYNLKNIREVIKEIGIASSLSEAKKLIEGKAVKLNAEQILNINEMIPNSPKGKFTLSVGKKKFFNVTMIARFEMELGEKTIDVFVSYEALQDYDRSNKDPQEIWDRNPKNLQKEIEKIAIKKIEQNDFWKNNSILIKTLDLNPIKIF